MEGVFFLLIQISNDVFTSEDETGKTLQQLRAKNIKNGKSSTAEVEVPVPAAAAHPLSPSASSRGGVVAANKKLPPAATPTPGQAGASKKGKSAPGSKDKKQPTQEDEDQQPPSSKSGNKMKRATKKMAKVTWAPDEEEEEVKGKKKLATPKRALTPGDKKRGLGAVFDELETIAEEDRKSSGKKAKPKRKVDRDFCISPHMNVERMNHVVITSIIRPPG